MAEAPFISGSDILSNPGNAALGYSSGVAYNSNPNSETPFGTGVQSSLLALQQEQAYNRQVQAAQAIKERNDLAEYLAGTGQSPFNMKGESGQDMSFNMLPDDRQHIEQKADELRRKIVQNPTTWKFDPEIKKQQSEFNQLRHHAGMRAIDYANKQQQMAKSNDVEERTGIQSNIESELTGKKLDEYHLPAPYLPAPTGDITKIVPADVLSGKDKNAWDDINSTIVDQNGNQVQVTYPGIRASVLDVRGRLLPGSPEFTNAANMVTRMYNNPSLMSSWHILAENKAIDKYNADRNLTPDSPNYANHLAEVLPNGEVIPKPLNARTIPDVTYSLLASHAGQLGREAKITKTAAEVGKDKLDIVAKKADIAKKYADIENDKQRLKLDRDKMTKADYDNQNAELQSKTAALGILENIHSASNFKNIDEVIRSVPKGVASGLATTLAEDGIATDDYEVAVVNKNMRPIAGLQKQKLDGTFATGVTDPEYTYILKPKSGNISDYKYLVGYKTLEPEKKADGSVVINKSNNKPQMREVTAWKTVTPQEAIGNSIKVNKNFYNISDKTGNDINRAIDYFGSITGAQSPMPQVAQQSEAPPAEGAKRTDNGKRQLYTGGQWKTVIGKDKKGNFVFE